MIDPDERTIYNKASSHAKSYKKSKMELLLISEIKWVKESTPDMEEYELCFLKVVKTENQRCLRC